MHRRARRRCLNQGDHGYKGGEGTEAGDQHEEEDEVDDDRREEAHREHDDDGNPYIQSMRSQLIHKKH